MLLSLLSLNDIAKDGIILYTAAYSLATIGVFAILIKMKDYTFEGFNGLAKSQPVLAATCTIFLLSLAGIPLTGGFFAKYYMLSSVISGGKFLWLVIFAVLCAAFAQEEICTHHGLMLLADRLAFVVDDVCVLRFDNERVTTGTSAQGRRATGSPRTPPSRGGAS